MAAILSLIYCWLTDFFPSLNDYLVGAYDKVLGVVDSVLASVGTAGLIVPVIDPQYTWVLGATGMGPAIGIIAGALITRFTLQTIPFVRWGS